MAQSSNGIPATNNTFNSITRQAKYEPFDLQVARGQVYGHSVLNIYGYQAAVGTSFVPVWEGNTTYTFPSSAIQMHVASSVNTGDDKTNTFVLINGLDANYNQISETIKLNGTTAVTTVKSYLRINSMSVTTGAPTGNITLKDTSDTTLYAEISFSVILPVGAPVVTDILLIRRYDFTVVTAVVPFNFIVSEIWL